ncbi:MAG: hypothetical protein IKO61_00040 [Lachnospiraceae bacterium]|nr:hypothetical protein [Lachnospiraceae bacterium]
MRVRHRLLVTGLIPVLLTAIIYIIAGAVNDSSSTGRNIIIAIPCVVIGYIIIFLMSKHTVDSIEEETKLIEMMADGNLHFEISDDIGHDEISRIRHSVIKLQDEIREVMTDLNKDADQLKNDSLDFSSKFGNIHESVDNINVAMEEIAEGNTVLAQEATSQAEAMMNMSISIDNNISSIRDLDRSVKNMTQFADFVKNILSELEDISVKVNENIAAVTRKTLETNESANNINKVIQMIHGISEQTNLLSLNASIEAARAGEAGKGFSVVASEIMKLAKESSDNATQINEIVADLSKNSLENVDMMKEVDEISRIQKEKLDQTLAAFVDLEKEVSVVDTASHNISNSVDELNHQKVAINESIEQLAAVSEENAASTEETSASMNEVTDILESLVEESKELFAISEDIHHQTDMFNK